MKYVKMLGLAAIAAAALMAFVGASSASADVLCKNASGTCETVANLTSENEGVVKLTTTFKTIECKKSTVGGSVTEDASGKPVAGNITALTFEECNCTVTVLKKGTLTAEALGNGNGTVKSNEAEVTTTCSTIFGTVHCIYTTSNTTLGTLTGGSPAKLDVERAEIPRQATSPACAEEAFWDATYKVTSPTSLFVRTN